MRFFLILAGAIIVLALMMIRIITPYHGTVSASFKDINHADNTGYQPLAPPPFEYVSGCSFPGLADDAKLVLLSTYGAQSVSSATLGSQDVVVTAGTLEIEDGDTPLYIVLVSFEPVIWKVSGAVNRVLHLVLAAEETNATLFGTEPALEGLAGATGIAAEKVRILENHECLHHFNGAETQEAAAAVEAMRHYLSRKPDVIAGAEHVSGFSAPSGDIHQAGQPFVSLLAVLPQRILEVTGLHKPMPSSDAELRYDRDRFRPGGVMEVDAAQVVSRHAAAPYQVLPQEAGVVQLIEQGALTPDGNGTLVINRPIRFPAGLAGAHARHFALQPGVAMPTGKPGHSCIVSQQTGKVLLNDGMC